MEFQTKVTQCTRPTCRAPGQPVEELVCCNSTCSPMLCMQLPRESTEGTPSRREVFNCSRSMSVCRWQVQYHGKFRPDLCMSPEGCTYQATNHITSTEAKQINVHRCFQPLTAFCGSSPYIYIDITESCFSCYGSWHQETLRLNWKVVDAVPNKQSGGW